MRTASGARGLLLVAVCVAMASGGALLALQVRTPEGDDPTETAPFDEDVLFLTNRKANERASQAPAGGRFTGGRGSLQYGRCIVRFNAIPKAGELAARVEFYVPTEIPAIQAVEALARGAFFDALEERPSSAEGDEQPIVVYVHGYAYGFDRTCRMGAELQRMLGEQAAAVMFSWPSDANPVDYVADQVDVEWSVPDLAMFLNDLAERFGSDRLRILAHSIGSRGTLFALAQLRLEGRRDPVADHLVLLAPDFDAGSFERQSRLIRPMVRRVTLYASDKDRPLAVSEALHGHPRLGQAGAKLTVLPGMETVDVSALGRYHPSGHEYFYYHPVVADDLVSLLIGGSSDEGCPHRVRRERNGIGYWSLEPAEC